MGLGKEAVPTSTKHNSIKTENICDAKTAFYNKMNFHLRNMKLSVILFFLFALALPVMRAEVYSSASDMKQVFQLEREMVSILGGFASKLHAKLNRINDYLKVSVYLNVIFIWEIGTGNR